MAELTADTSTIPRIHDADGGPFGNGAVEGREDTGPATSARTTSPLKGSEAQLAAYVRELFTEAREARRPMVGRWRRSYQVLHNRTWANRATWMPSPELAEIWPIMASRVGWMMDQRPTFTAVPSASPFSPTSEYYAQLGQDLETTIHSSWHNNNVSTQVATSLWDTGIYGTGILKTIWDPNLSNGQGDWSVRRVDPFTFYPDPACTSLDDANYFIEARTLSAQEIDRRFPGTFDKLISNAWQEDIDKAPLRSDGVTSEPRRSNPISIDGGPAKFTSPTNRLSGALHHQGVTVFECWLRVHTTVDEDVPDPNSADPGKMVTVTRTVDTWRVVVVAGNNVLMDESVGNLWSHGQHPYDRIVDIETGEFWGQSLVELLTPAQLSINRLLAAAEHNIALMGNPVFIEDARAGMSRQQITNRPGQRLQMNSSAAKAEWMAPPQMHPAMAGDLIRFYKAEMENISGSWALTRGGSPGGRPSAGAIDSIQDAAFVRIRLALSNLEAALNSAGQKAAALICEFYDEPRMIAVVGPGGHKTALAIRTQHFYLPSGEGRTPMRFQILIEAGSTTPTSRTARAAEADVLFGMGALDREAVLEAHQWPNRHLITERVNAAETAGTFNAPGARQRSR